MSSSIAFRRSPTPGALALPAQGSPRDCDDERGGGLALDPPRRHDRRLPLCANALDSGEEIAQARDLLLEEPSSEIVEFDGHPFSGLVAK